MTTSSTIEAGPPSTRGATARRWRLAALAALALGLAVVGSCSWYISSRIEDGALRPDHGPHTFGLEVVATTEDSVTVRPIGSNDADRPGIRALEWRIDERTGWLQLGPIASSNTEDAETTRPILFGAPPPLGAEARFDNYAYLGTPNDLGLAYDEVRYEADLGPTPAWEVCGGRSRWLIHVHGKDSDPREVLRMLPTVSDLGFTTLAISYTNDLAAPANESGRYEYGASEWRDVEGAVRYALDHGARQVVLAGHSMGGAIIASFLLESDLAASVDAAILDAPMLDFHRTVAMGLEDGGVPGVLQPLPIWLAGVRFGLDWDRLDYAGRAEGYSTPMLIFHGTNDDYTPIEASERLAEARPDLVTYERFEGAHHTGAWNVDPTRYEAAIRDFVTTHLGPTPEVPTCAIED
ncbi:MAG: alpha/beta hydrolase [Dehalococcoidia bacterium]